MPKLTKYCPVCNTPADEKSFTVIPPPINLKVINLKCGHSYTEKIEELKEWQKIETYEMYGKKIKLFPYQGLGYEFARESGFRALIADEPGLGKTFQAYSCLRLHPEILTPCLVVCKSALKIQQFRAAMQLLGSDFMPEIIQKSSDRPSGLFNVTIVTYDLLWRIVKKQNEAREKLELEIRDKLRLSEWDIIPEEYQKDLPVVENPFATHGFKFVILDECQQIKNQSSRRAQQVREICQHIPHVIATSGSPIENHAGEYFTILNILRPERFRNYKDYVMNYCDYQESAYGTKVGGIRDIEYFKQQTKDFIIRRKMKDVQADLPPLQRKFISCEFATDKLKREYEEMQQEFSKYFYENEGTEDFQQGILARIAKMRHKTGISKVPFCVEYVSDFLNDTNEKLVIFTEHLDVADVLELRLISELEKMRETGSEIANPLRYKAELNSQQRDEVVTEFTTNPHRRIFIASTKAASEGLDGLQKVCNHVIFLERQWNPKKEEQGEKRVQRIGSYGTGVEDSHISADYILVTNSIDEYFTELVEIKRANTDQTLDGVEYDFNEASLVKELSAVLAQKGSKKWKLK
jgi:SNF2 family DNA or RNA helicase